MDVQQGTQIGAEPWQQLRSKRQANGQGAKACLCRVHLVKGQHKGLQLFIECDFGLAQHVPHLGAALGIGFSQCTQVAIGHGFHQFFHLKLAQHAGQQADALVLLPDIEEPKHADDQRKKKDRHYEKIPNKVKVKTR